jgi:hypothetical protein
VGGEKGTKKMKPTKFSDDRKYRYTLWREWDMSDGAERQGFGRERAYVMFIGLNPSTADETLDDPTIQRCVGFAKAWGFGMMCMTNLFAYRATLPSDMLKALDPVGPENNASLTECALGACFVIAAWGAHGKYRGRDKSVCALLSNLPAFRTDSFQHLGRNKDGSPKHPLYLRKDVTRETFWKRTDL